MRILILGGGILGRLIAEALRGEFEVTIIEKDELRAQTLSEGGLNVVHGDFSYTATLLKAGIDKADLLVITTMDLETIKKTVYVVRSNSKNIPIVTVLPDGTTIESIKEDLKASFEADLNIDYAITPHGCH